MYSLGQWIKCTKREGNRVADDLAKLAFSTYEMYWMEECPSQVLSDVSLDMTSASAFAVF